VQSSRLHKAGGDGRFAPRIMHFSLRRYFSDLVRVNRTFAPLAILIAMGSIVFPAVASASYNAIDNRFVGSSTVDTAQWALIGLNDGMRLDVLVNGTTTYSLVNNLAFAICNTGNSTGRLDLEVRHLGTTTLYEIAASSTLSMGSFPTIGCGANGGAVNGATSTTFELNQNISQTSILPMWVSIYARGGLTGTAYFSWRNVDLQGLYVTGYRDNVLQAPVALGYTYSPWMYAISSGVVGGGGIQVEYSASTTAVICTTFDVGCYISTALAWAFYPTYSISDRVEELSSTTAGVIPFGFVYDFVDLFTGYAGHATTTATVSVELSGIMNFMGASFSSSTMTVLSGATLRSTMGTTMWNFSQNIFRGCMWLGFLFYVYRRSIHFL